jgi:hypothetical protein
VLELFVFSHLLGLNSSFVKTFIDELINKCKLSASLGWCLLAALLKVRWVVTFFSLAVDVTVVCQAVSVAAREALLIVVT